MTTIHIPESARFDRVREDVERGRLWKARDRLNGLLIESPTDQDVLDLVGSIWFEMGDLPQAGRYWWLTERDDERADRAREAFHERFGRYPGGILTALPRLTHLELYPSPVRARLEELVTAATSDGRRWVPWEPRPATRPAVRPNAPTLSNLLALGVFLFILLLVVVGFLNVAGAILRAIFG